VLASLLLPALAKAKSVGLRAGCAANLKTLQLAWSLYANEKDDTIAPNQWANPDWSNGCPQGYGNANGSWVLGDAATTKNDSGIRNGVLYNYVGASKPYLCPADSSKNDQFPRLPRTRSYSASFYMNGNKN